MPRRDQISESKKQRLQQEQELLQKLMFEARSSVRRSSLKEQNETEPENRLYPPLGGKGATTNNNEITEYPEPDNVLWPKLNTQQPVQEQPEEVAAPKNLLTEKDLFPNQEILEASIAEPLPEILEQHTGKQPLTESDLFPADHAAIELPRQPQERGIRVILPEQNLSATIESHEVRPEETVYERAAAGTAIFSEAHVKWIEKDHPAADTIEAAEKRKRSPAISYAVMTAAALLLGAGGYYFYTKSQHTDNPVAENKSEQASIPAPKTSTIPSTNPVTVDTKNETKAEPAKPVVTESKKEPVEKKAEKPTVKPPVSEPKETAPVTKVSSGTGQYKVISKAYFHDEPEESTRRKAFIIHWNNAVLTPLEGKNGFIYIVFTNHLGQTSKGWLRKKDLKPLN